MGRRSTDSSITKLKVGIGAREKISCRASRAVTRCSTGPRPAAAVAWQHARGRTPRFATGRNRLSGVYVELHRLRLQPRRVLEERRILRPATSSFISFSTPRPPAPLRPVDEPRRRNAPPLLVRRDRRHRVPRCRPEPRAVVLRALPEPLQLPPEHVQDARPGPLLRLPLALLVVHRRHRTPPPAHPRPHPTPPPHPRVTPYPAYTRNPGAYTRPPSPQCPPDQRYASHLSVRLETGRLTLWCECRPAPSRRAVPARPSAGRAGVLIPRYSATIGLDAAASSVRSVGKGSW